MESRHFSSKLRKLFVLGTAIYSLLNANLCTAQSEKPSILNEITKLEPKKIEELNTFHLNYVSAKTYADLANLELTRRSTIEELREEEIKRISGRHSNLTINNIIDWGTENIRIAALQLDNANESLVNRKIFQDNGIDYDGYTSDILRGTGRFRLWNVKMGEANFYGFVHYSLRGSIGSNSDSKEKTRGEQSQIYQKFDKSLGNLNDSSSGSSSDGLLGIRMGFSF